MASVPEQIAELGRLLERGLLTRAQFERQRDDILSSGGRLRRRSGDRPERIGAYQILGTIGEGGMGIVYRGRHRSAGVARRQGGEVAIKVLHPRLARNPAFIKRFEREATLGLELDHPGLVQAFDLIVDGDVTAFVMELVEGTLLSEYIRRRTGAIRWDDSWHMFQQVLSAVIYAHDRGVIHRDLKPDNIIIGEDGKLRVIDLGIAKGQTTSSTRTGLAMGTVDYMAPEQHEDAKRVTPRADVYSLAMTLYEMLAGRLPWDSSVDAVAVLSAKRRGRFAPPSHFAPGIPAQVVKALMPALDPDPKCRYSSVSELRDALETAHFRTALAGDEEPAFAIGDEEDESVEAERSRDSDASQAPEPPAGAAPPPKTLLDRGTFEAATGFEELAVESNVPAPDEDFRPATGFAELLSEVVSRPVSTPSERPPDDIATEPHLVVEKSTSGTFQAVRATREYAAERVPETGEEGSGADSLHGSGSVAAFWKKALVESSPGLPSRLEDLRVRAKRRTAKRQAPGRGGQVPERHRTVRQKEFFPTEPRSRARLFLTGFVGLLLVELMGFGMLYYEDWLRIRELEAGNERLVAAIEEHKADAIEVSRLMEEDRKIRDVLGIFDQSARLQRQPALALEQIEIAKPLGELWIDEIRLGGPRFSVNAFIKSDSDMDTLFLDSLESGSLLSEVQITSRSVVGSTRPGYDQIKIEGKLGLPKRAGKR